MYVYLFMSQKKLKIALLGDTLANGGAERIHSTLSLYFDKQNIEVCNIINLNDITYPYGGQLINLGVYLKNGQSVKAKIQRFKALYSILKREKFDFILDFRTRTKPFTESILNAFVFKSNYIPTVHSSYFNWYFTNNKNIGKLIYQKKKVLICVSSAITEKINQVYNYRNVQTIYNPIDILAIEKQALEATLVLPQNYIVACGSMHSDIKQFDRLIDCYLQSDLPQTKIHLVIIGEGKQRKALIKYVKQLNMDSFIHLIGYQSNPYSIFKKAKYFVLSSRLEGFPTVLLEALACGIPVISFDCPTGPSEIIDNYKNGMLIPAQDFQQLTQIMNQLANDPNLLSTLKLGSKKSIERFSIDEIGKEWLKLFNDFSKY